MQEKEIIAKNEVREGVRTKLNSLVKDVDLNVYITTMVENGVNEQTFNCNGSKYRLVCIITSRSNYEGYAIAIRLIGIENNINAMFIATFDSNLNCIECA